MGPGNRGAQRGPVIAIDGPGGVGKTTVSRLVAERLSLRYINTGSMYRIIALGASDAGIDINSDEALGSFCSKAAVTVDEKTGHFLLNGADYTDRLRTEEAGALASVVSAKTSVRDFLVAIQRSLGAEGGVVMEGRDIGTVVFPDADAKFFLDASHEVRAARRHLELAAKNKPADHDEISRELAERDRRDIERENSPLKAADDAVYIDTGPYSIEEIVELICKKAKELFGSGDTCR